MKVNEIIYEDFDPYQSHNLQNPGPVAIKAGVSKVENVQKLAAIIEANCGTMLAAYRNSNQVLLRGVSKATSDVIITQIRPNRKPVQMTPETHAALEKAYKELGFKATRSNSIFCTCRGSIARDWGNVYAIFLKDGWEGLVFKKVRNDYSFYQVQGIARHFLYNHHNKERMKQAILDLEPRTFNDTPGLEYVLDGEFVDVIITGSSYIGVRCDGSYFNELMRVLKIEYEY